MKFFQELNELVTNTSTGKVLAVVFAIYAIAGSVGLGVAYWITHRH